MRKKDDYKVATLPAFYLHMIFLIKRHVCIRTSVFVSFDFILKNVIHPVLSHKYKKYYYTSYY